MVLEHDAGVGPRLPEEISIVSSFLAKYRVEPLISGLPGQMLGQKAWADMSAMRTSRTNFREMAIDYTADAPACTKPRLSKNYA